MWVFISQSINLSSYLYQYYYLENYNFSVLGCEMHQPLITEGGKNHLDY